VRPFASSRSVDVSRLIAGGTAFLAWWGRELAAVVPPGLRRTLGRRNRSLLVELAGDEAGLAYVSGETPRAIGRVDLRAPNREWLRDPALRKFDHAKTDVVVRLPAEVALRKAVLLPQSAERNLREVLGFELPRQAPFKSEDVYFDAAIRRRLPETRQIEVGLTIVPRSAVHEAVDRVSALGIAADFVDVAGAAEGSSPSGNLLPAQDLGEARWATRSAPLVLACCAAALAGIAVFLPLAQERRAAAALGREVAMARAEAERVATARDEIERLLQDDVFLAKRRREAVRAVAVLNDLTRLLPDDTWLSQLQLTGRETQLFGYSTSAATLIGLIEGSRSFRDATFRSPVIQDAKTGHERFQISAQIPSGTEK
jgi:general secretion pathway protein L